MKGRPEYMTCGRLADYEYIHQCYKYNLDVKLALIHRYSTNVAISLLSFYQLLHHFGVN